MINSVLNAVGWQNPQDYRTWDLWMKWQKTQPIQHYKHSMVFEYYMKNSKSNIFFEEVEHSFVSEKALTATENYYKYCFGEFYTFLMPIQKDIPLFDALKTLVNIYDVCKGYSRVLFGDTDSIIFLKKVISLKDVSMIKNHDFSDSLYDYDLVHAHTVAHFSLSTLIMLIASNYVGRITNHKNHKIVNFERCKQAFERHVFGIPEDVCEIKSEPIDIVPFYRFHITSNSWPITKQIKCIKCARLTEGTWGKFGYCLDCHLKKACSSCGADAQGKSENDDMPKCGFHLKLEQQK